MPEAKKAVLEIAKKEYPKIPFKKVFISGIGEDSKGQWWIQAFTDAGDNYEVEQWFVYFDGKGWHLADSGTGLERNDEPPDIKWEDVK